MSCRKPFLYRVKQLKGRARWLWAHQRHTSGTPASLDYSDGALRGVSTRGCGYITRTRRLESAVTAGPKGLIAQEYGIHVLAAVVRRVGMRSGQAEDRLLIVFDSERKKKRSIQVLVPIVGRPRVRLELWDFNEITGVRIYMHVLSKARRVCGQLEQKETATKRRSADEQGQGPQCSGLGSPERAPPPLHCKGTAEGQAAVAAVRYYSGMQELHGGGHWRRSAGGGVAWPRGGPPLDAQYYALTVLHVAVAWKRDAP